MKIRKPINVDPKPRAWAMPDGSERSYKDGPLSWAQFDKAGIGSAAVYHYAGGEYPPQYLPWCKEMGEEKRSDATIFPHPFSRLHVLVFSDGDLIEPVARLRGPAWDEQQRAAIND